MTVGSLNIFKDIEEPCKCKFKTICYTMIRIFKEKLFILLTIANYNSYTYYVVNFL